MANITKWEVRSRNSEVHRNIALEYFALPASDFRLRIGAPTWIRTTSLRLRRAACRISCTLGAENRLPDLDSHQDTRLNRPPCYFDTIRQ